MKYQVILWILLLNFFSTKAQNPIITDRYTADPAAMVYDGTVFLYTGHDEGTSYYNMNDWQLFTSTNMVNWTAHGEVMNVNVFSWARGDAWAAEVEERNGKFYYYVCAEHNSISGKAIGVAVSDSPYGPFTDARGTALVTNNMTTQVNSTWDDIDPTVFIDDNGDAYIYWGNSGCYYAKLKDNMIELDGGIHFVDLPSFTEAPFLHKKDNLYYLTYAYGWEEKIAYATAPSITGPWTFRGVLNDNVNNCNTNHQAIIEFKNQWYFVYHTGDIGGSYQRSVAIDYLFYNEDGTMREIVQTTDGVQSTLQTENCLPLPVDIRFNANETEMQIGKSAVLNQKEQITIQASVNDEGGSWQWNGPNGNLISGSELTLTNVTADMTGTYKATYTSNCGTKSIGLFDLTVSPVISGHTYVIRPLNSDLCISLEGGANVDGTNVILSNNLNTNYQRFVFTNEDEEYYRITPANAPDEAIDIFNISTDDGANAVIWNYWGGSGQQFALTPAGNNAYYLVARHSGKCLDWRMSDNNLIQYSIWGGDNQKFTLTEWFPASTNQVNKSDFVEIQYAANNARILNLHFNKEQASVKIQLYDLSGKAVLDQMASSNQNINLNFQELNSGTYLLMVSTANEKITKRVMLK